MNIKKIILMGAVALLPILPPMAADAGGWEVSLKPHVWLPTLNGDTSSSDGDVPDTEVETALDAALMLNLEVRRDRWGILAHGMYTELSVEGTSPGPVYSLIDTTFELGELDLALFSRVTEGRWGWLDLLGGARYMRIGMDTTKQPNNPALDPVSHSAASDWVAPFAGLRGRLILTDWLYAGGRSDIGGFGVGCDLVWQAYAGIGVNLGKHVEVEAGWRYLAIDYDENHIKLDAALSGVVLGLGFIF